MESDSNGRKERPLREVPLIIPRRRDLKVASRCNLEAVGINHPPM
ncbi:MAG: hypothetical protein ACOX77_07825 [Caldicoprobacterales bacterium]